MSATLRTLLALFLLFSAVAYWFGDFNQYVVINGLKYVDSRPPPAIRGSYSAGIGALATLPFGIAMLIVRRSSSRPFRVGFLSLAPALTAVLFLVADLNLYVIGWGPEGRDWVKVKSTGMERSLVCVAIGCVLALVALPLLRRITGTTGTPAESRSTA